MGVFGLPISYGGSGAQKHSGLALVFDFDRYKLGMIILWATKHFMMS